MTINATPLQKAMFAALVALLIATILVGRELIRRVMYPPGARPAPVIGHTQVALLLGSRTRAVLASIAMLRAAGAIDSADDGTLFTLPAAPTGANDTDRAILAEVNRGGSSWPWINNDGYTATTLRTAAVQLHRAGLIATSTKWASRIAWMTTAVAVVEFIGLLPLTGVPFADGPALVITGSPFVIAVGLGLVRLPPSSRARRRIEGAARREHGPPNPGPAGRWPTDPQQAGMVVAVRGISAIWDADPAFAKRARLPVRDPDDDGSSSLGESE